MNDFNDFGNPQVARLPKHLRQFIVKQHCEKYRPIDQAVWRYYPYINGLRRAGLSIEYIPDLQTMNDNFGKFGWAVR